MNDKYNKFLIALSLILIASSFYLYFSNSEHSDAAEGSLSSSLNNNQSPAGAFAKPNDSITLDIAFIDTLTSLRKIDVDTSLFSSPSFNSLKDNTVSLSTDVVTGRPNPFAPVNSVSTGGNASISPVVTNQPAQITDRTVVFEGVVNATSGVGPAYFEYGTTENLGKITSTAEQSLIGMFVKKVVNLTPKTTYFFRAAARINGSAQYGEIVSFTTN